MSRGVDEDVMRTTAFSAGNPALRYGDYDCRRHHRVPHEAQLKSTAKPLVATQGMICEEERRVGIAA